MPRASYKVRGSAEARRNVQNRRLSFHDGGGVTSVVSDDRNEKRGGGGAGGIRRGVGDGRTSGDFKRGGLVPAEAFSFLGSH